MPYVYNIKENSKEKELEEICYEDKIIASYLPEVIVEYGVFFDGTKNNIYNIDFYRNFVEFLKEPAKNIENVGHYSENEGLKKGNIEKEILSGIKSTQIENIKQGTIEEYILSTDNPEFTNETKKIIINQMNNASKKLRYFDNKSNLSLSDD
ncbi:hypothetical protein, partial [Malaciobacter molluscorum]